MEAWVVGPMAAAEETNTIQEEVVVEILLREVKAVMRHHFVPSFLLVEKEAIYLILHRKEYLKAAEEDVLIIIMALEQSDQMAELLSLLKLPILLEIAFLFYQMHPMFLL